MGLGVETELERPSVVRLHNGSVVIRRHHEVAPTTSQTPRLSWWAAGLIAKKAVEKKGFDHSSLGEGRGLAPGSQVR